MLTAGAVGGVTASAVRTPGVSSRYGAAARELRRAGDCDTAALAGTGTWGCCWGTSVSVLLDGSLARAFVPCSCLKRCLAAHGGVVL